MAKHKPQRALFEILAKERAQERRPTEGGPGPVVRRMGSAEAGPASVPADSSRLRRDSSAGFERRGAKYVWVALVAAGVLGLFVLFIIVGMWLSGPPLPSVPERPTMEEVGEGPTEADLVSPAPPAPAPAPAPSPAPSPAPAPAPAAEGKVRLRIARLEVSRSEYTDQLRTLLAERGMETDLEARSGYFVLYSQARFASPEADDAKAFLGKVEAVQKEFERKTGWPATTNPYFVTVP